MSKVIAALLLGAVLTACTTTTASEPTARKATGGVRIGTPVSMHLDTGEDAVHTPSATERIGRMTVHGTLALAAFAYPGNTRLGGISGLGWSADSGILYAVSDFGVLWHWRPIIEDGRLRSVEVLGAWHLRWRDGKVLTGGLPDAEGLTVLNGNNGNPDDDKLVVSYEQVPRIMVHGVHGEHADRLPLPAPYGQVRTYHGNNHALEAVSLLPAPRGRVRYLSAPERPLRNDKSADLPLFTNNGPKWTYPLGDGPNNGVVALEALPDGGVVFIERAYGALPPRLALRVRYVPALPAAPNARLAPETLAEASTLAGQRIDNFEGFTHHEGNRFFLVSDDNKNFLQRTLLTYIELDL